MTRARRAALCLAFACALLSLSAQGETRRTAIALVAGGADQVLQARLRAELGALGWRVLMLPASELVPAQIARRVQALAVLRVARDGSGIELWVAPEFNASARSEWLEVEPLHPELAVVRAVESLRARLLELGLEPEDASDATTAEPEANAAPPPPTTIPSAATPTAPAPVSVSRADRGWLELAVGGVAPGSHISWTPAFSASARYTLSPWLAADFSAGFSPLPAHVHSADASTELRSGWLALAAELRQPLGLCTFALGAGAAGVLLDFQGASSKAELSGRHVSKFSALPHARAAIELGLTRSLRLRLQGVAGVSTPRVKVFFVDRSVASWGRPLIGVELGLTWAVLR